MGENISKEVLTTTEENTLKHLRNSKALEFQVVIEDKYLYPALPEHMLMSEKELNEMANYLMRSENE